MKKFILAGFLLLSYFNTAFAEQDVNLDGVITQTVITNKPRPIQFLKLKLSHHGLNLLQHRLEQKASKPSIKFAASAPQLPSQVNLGMNHVPVLDQGQNGTCSTFAVTAAIDAVLNKGDYLSQLCLLSLSDYLANHAHIDTMWQGAYPNDVLHLISTFGIVNKEKQHLYGCGGLTEYPQKILNNHPQMDLDSYYQISEDLNAEQYISGHNFFNPTELIDDPSIIENLVQTTKQILFKGHRLVIGMALVPDEYAGAYGRYHVGHDTWVLTTQLINNLKNNPDLAGHAMVITGYDDTATVIDHEGKPHLGVFILRNSWGSYAGDHGNYYMSYDYFKALAFELTKITLYTGD